MKWYACAFACLCMCMCVCALHISSVCIVYACAYFSKEAALIVLPGASSEVDKEHVPLGS